MTDRKRLTKKLDDVCRDIVRMRDKSTCQWCGKYVVGSDSHPSHVLAKKRHGHLRWDLNNIKLLCFNCHRHKWHDDHIASGAMEWFKSKFPNRYEYLMARKEENKKFRIPELESLLAELLDYKQNLQTNVW